jgi:hypothetical protein
VVLVASGCQRRCLPYQQQLVGDDVSSVLQGEVQRGGQHQLLLLLLLGALGAGGAGGGEVATGSAHCPRPQPWQLRVAAVVSAACTWLGMLLRCQGGGKGRELLLCQLQAQGERRRPCCPSSHAPTLVWSSCCGLTLGDLWVKVKGQGVDWCLSACRIAWGLSHVCGCCTTRVGGCINALLLLSIVPTQFGGGGRVFPSRHPSCFYTWGLLRKGSCRPAGTPCTTIMPLPLLGLQRLYWGGWQHPSGVQYMQQQLLSRVGLFVVQ